MTFFVHYDIDNFIEFYDIIFKECVSLSVNDYKDLEKIVETH